MYWVVQMQRRSVSAKHVVHMLHDLLKVIMYILWRQLLGSIIWSFLNILLITLSLQ